MKRGKENTKTKNTVNKSESKNTITTNQERRRQRGQMNKAKHQPGCGADGVRTKTQNAMLNYN